MQIGPFSYELSALSSLQLRDVLGVLNSTIGQRTAGRSSAALRSITLGAKVAMDKTLCALRLAFMSTPSAQEWLRIIHEINDARALWDARGWSRDPARYHVCPPGLNSPVLRRARSGRVPFLDLQFESGYEPHRDEPGRARWLDHAANRTAHAWVLQHPGRPRPWLMCVHGYGLGIPFIDFQTFPISWLHHALGLNLVFPVLPLHGPRRIRRQSGDGFFAGDALDTIHAEAQAVWDLRRILSWVRQQGPPAVGIYGLSLGGYNAALLAGLDPDLACVIAGVPPTDFVQLARHHLRPTALILAEQAGLSWDDAAHICRVISPLRLRPRVARERRYVFGGLADHIVPPDQVRELWRHWERPRVAWYHGSHLSLPWEPSVTALLREALSRTLCGRDQPAEIERAVA